MTGPEHYAMAQALLDEADTLEDGIGSLEDHDDRYRAGRAERLTARAQVHATLALTAATAGTIPDQESGLVGAWNAAGAW